MPRPFLFLFAALLGVAAAMLTVALPAQQTGTQADRTRPASADSTGRERSYPAGSSMAQIAALREDIRGLSSMVREQNLIIEELQRQNRTLEQRMREYEGVARESQSPQQSGNFATMSQVNRALEEMAENFRGAQRDQRREIIEQVGRQIDELARETQRAMDSLARNVSSSGGGGSAPAGSAAASPSFSDDYPEEGLSYTVRSGDTLSSIASRHNARVRDIVNANRIEDPNRLRVGQTLFIPQRD